MEDGYVEGVVNKHHAPIVPAEFGAVTLVCIMFAIFGEVRGMFLF